MVSGKMYVIVNEETGKPAIINGRMLQGEDKSEVQATADAMNRLPHEPHEEWIVMPLHLVQGYQA